MTHLGPYRLEHPLGRGGMGAVYAAVHAPTGVPAAVKVLHEDAARRTDLRALLLQEVHAAAALDHPGIVRVLDAGSVPARAAAERPELVAGTPWFAMERVDGRSLQSWRGRLPWERLREIALGLLAALGHAHARGVVHRDLKPSNVLLGRDGQPRLLDFGIAHRIAPEGPQGALVSGTPAFMAPEQADASGRDLGPWTDLFAFGALVWAMVAGRPPFRATRLPAIVRERHQPLPPLRAISPVPDGLEGWLAVLLRPDPGARFQRAADAAAALVALSARGRPPRRGRPIPEEEPTVIVPTPSTPQGVSTAPTVLLDPARVRPRAPGAAAAPPAPPIGPEPPAPPPRPVVPGTGLGLWGLRDPPFVGRTEERERLWALLRAVDRGGVRVVLLTGPAGCGKSRLARWLCEGAHEAGAHVLRAIHGPSPAPAHGLAAMVARDLGCAGLAGDALEERLRARAPDPGTARRLRALLDPAGASERYAAFVDHLVALGAGRPVVAWIDDLPHGTDAQGALLHLLAVGDRPGLRALVVATADSDDGLPPVLDELVAAGAERWSLGLLPEVDHAALVGNLVGLGGRLAADLAVRTGGNPLFAVQLVSDWVARGWLVPTTHGFELPPGVHPEVPAGLVEVWRGRVEDGLAGLPEDDAVALERAAVLGVRIEPESWRAACAVDGITPSAGLFERLAARRLVTPADGGWALAHGLLAEALRRRAHEGGRLAAHHLACAAATSDPARRGWHLLAGGRPAEAIDFLFEGSGQKRRLAADYRGALADLARVEEALDQLGADDRRRGHLWDRQAVCLRALGRYAEARALSTRVLARLDEPGWAAIEGGARLTAAHIARDGGDLAAAEAHALAGLAAAEREGDRELAGTVWIELGYVAWWRKQLPLAEERFRRARELLAEDDSRQADLAYARALVAISRRAPDEVLAHLARAAETYEATGHRLGLARVANARASALCEQGRTDEAITCWEQALRLYGEVGSGDEIIPRLNLASVHVDHRRFAEALQVLEPMRFRLDEGRPFFAGALELLRASALCRLGPQTAFREALARADELLARAPRPDAETAGIAEALAAAARDPEDARRAWELAAVLWSRAGDEARAARARRHGA